MSIAPNMHSGWWPVIVIGYAALLFGTATIVNAIVNEPYMDEIFHIPQAQRYCNGDYFAWDPMITTPPGLYIISSSILTPLGQWIQQDLCTTSILRGSNIIFATGILVVLSKLLKVLHPGIDSMRSNLYALALGCFPVSLFYTFLYYTDTGSTFFVLLSYLLAKQRRYFGSGLIALTSLAFRQTNIVWLIFTAGISVVDILSVNKKYDNQSRPLYNPLVDKANSIAQYLQSVQSLVIVVITNLPRLVLPMSTYILSIVTFASFIWWNKGIVLGDHSAHVAGLHFPQLFYFISFLTFFALPFVANAKSIRIIAQHIQTVSAGRIISMAAIASGILYLVHNYTYEHPYLLADNRHYSFYLWRKLYKRHWSVRYLLTPVYMGCGWLCYTIAAPSITIILLLAFTATTALTLVPSPLLEFRYFIIPFYIFLVHIKTPRKLKSLLAIGLYLSINVWTIWMFLHRGFIWDSEIGRVQRFIW
ncbi:putative alpha-1,2-glucosyltransferase ALG10-B-like protein [Umbelopsis sp. PMI_123]|nr:putative alpha-1,2-glucosyltransferase ALG10-B-like protein [Umbelopsis sp. PMI_123]